MSDLGEIIARLEKATGPDHELDIAIAKWRGVTVMMHKDGINVEETYWKYTAKIDDALSLASGMWSIFNMEEPGVKYLPANKDGDFLGAKEIYVAATSTIPIAICIAALKARQSLGVEGKRG